MPTTTHVQSAVHGILLTRLVYKSCKYELLQDVTTEDEVRCDIFQNLKLNVLEPKLYLVTPTFHPSGQVN
jgi:hypothetical protein